MYGCNTSSKTTYRIGNPMEYRNNEKKRKAKAKDFVAYTFSNYQSRNIQNLNNFENVSCFLSSREGTLLNHV